MTTKTEHWIVAFGTTLAISTVGCSRSDDRGATPAETDRASTVELTSAEVPPAPATATASSYRSVVEGERRALRSRVDEAVGNIDRILVERSGDRRSVPFNTPGSMAPTLRASGDVDRLVDRRAALADHARSLDSADERGWDELKATIERDLVEPSP